mmetsp:Transcript_42952/g.96664  ORF Transcript_42952/g.96664 Transcript_42952/m.96664 type:complete len:494 (-) Transcript_42952:1706-3187(-)
MRPVEHRGPRRIHHPLDRRRDPRSEPVRRRRHPHWHRRLHRRRPDHPARGHQDLAILVHLEARHGQHGGAAGENGEGLAQVGPGGQGVRGDADDVEGRPVVRGDLRPGAAVAGLGLAEAHQVPAGVGLVQGHLVPPGLVEFQGVRGALFNGLAVDLHPVVPVQCAGAVARGDELDLPLRSSLGRSKSWPTDRNIDLAPLLRHHRLTQPVHVLGRGHGEHLPRRLPQVGLRAPGAAVAHPVGPGAGGPLDLNIRESHMVHATFARPRHAHMIRRTRDPPHSIRNRSSTSISMVRINNLQPLPVGQAARLIAGPREIRPVDTEGERLVRRGALGLEALHDHPNIAGSPPGPLLHVVATVPPLAFLPELAPGAAPAIHRLTASERVFLKHTLLPLQEELPRLTPVGLVLHAESPARARIGYVAHDRQDLPEDLHPADPAGAGQFRGPDPTSAGRRRRDAVVGKGGEEPADLLVGLVGLGCDALFEAEPGGVGPLRG